MSFFIFVLLAIIAYLAWRIADQIPDIIFRMSEIQRDVAELRRMQLEAAITPAAKAAPAKRARKSSTAKTAASTSSKTATTSPDKGSAGKSGN